MSSSNIFQRLIAYALPSAFFLVSIICHILTALLHPLLLLTSLPQFRERAFSILWSIGGLICAIDTPAPLTPLLAHSSGTILDVGPGSGHQLFRFSKPKEIDAIYGVEPGVSMHDALNRRARDAGLGGKYHVLDCEAKIEALGPALKSAGLLHLDTSPPFDEIVCIRVLCGVPDMDKVIQDLYGLLKPGGKLIVCEHVENSGKHAEGGTVVGRLIQVVHMKLGWRSLMGGCELTRDTLTSLKRAGERDGGWKRVDVQLVDAWSTIPHIVGVLVKKG